MSAAFVSVSGGNAVVVVVRMVRIRRIAVCLNAIGVVCVCGFGVWLLRGVDLMWGFFFGGRDVTEFCCVCFGCGNVE